MTPPANLSNVTQLGAQTQLTFVVCIAPGAYTCAHKHTRYESDLSNIKFLGCK